MFALDLDKGIAEAPEVDGVTYVSADVTQPDQVRAAVEAAAAEGPLRVAVSCAGIAPSARVVGKKGTHDLDLYARVVGINLIGTFHVLALSAEQMAANQPDDDGERGVIVNTASIAAYGGQIGQVAYASSKGGVVGLTLPAARTSPPTASGSAIAPGIVETPMLATIPEDFRAALAADVPFPPRLARPDEYAALALAIIDHRYLNGEVIRMDGALRMTPR